MKKAIITGGSGFLGGAIAKHLEAHNVQPIIFDRRESTSKNHIQGDIQDKKSLEKAFDDIDLVFHIAGVLGTSELTQDNDTAVNVNVLGTVNVLEAAKTCGVEKIFYPTKPNEWLNTYSITKKAGEDFTKMFHELGLVEARILRWLNAYGPHQKLTPVRKAVPMMIVEALESEPLTIWGSGNQPVDLIFTEDLARITVEHTLSDKIDHQVYDTGLTHRMSVNDLAALIIDLCDSKSDIKHYPMRVGENEAIPVPLLEGKSSADILGISQATDLREGMLKTIEFYRSISKYDRERALNYYRCLSE